MGKPTLEAVLEEVEKELNEINAEIERKNLDKREAEGWQELKERSENSSVMKNIIRQVEQNDKAFRLPPGQLGEQVKLTPSEQEQAIGINYDDNYWEELLKTKLVF